MRHLLFAFCFITFLSCQESQAPINQIKMAAVLTDLHLAEALGQVSPIDSGGYMIKNRDSIFQHYQYIFDQHKVDPKEFKNGLDWYGQHPILFEKVYDEVLSKLSTLKEIPKEDSVKTSPKPVDVDVNEEANRPVSYEE